MILSWTVIPGCRLRLLPGCSWQREAASLRRLPWDLAEAESPNDEVTAPGALAKLVMSLKFVVPSLMLRFPVVGAWGTYVLDSIDGDVLLELGVSEETYQTIDKAADYFSYVIMLIVGLRWRIRRLIVLLFVYRTIGQALFFKTRKEIVFVYFPNFLEPLVLIYSLLLFRHKGLEPRAYAAYRRHRGPIWIIITGYKAWNEWSLHVADIDLSERVFGFTGGARVPAQTPPRLHSE